MREHVRILGILNIIMGSLTALGGVVVLIFMGGIASIVALSDMSPAELEHARVSASVVGIIGLVLGLFLLLLSLPAILGGWGLLTYKSWSRVLMIVVSVLHLLHVPPGDGALRRLRSLGFVERTNAPAIGERRSSASLANIAQCRSRDSDLKVPEPT